MILEVTRGHIRVGLLQKHVTISGEMFFSKNEKIGFVVYSDRIRSWDAPDDNAVISDAEREYILCHIREEFKKGGHSLEVE
jgi:Immunity protein 74